jgi:hypothetical protein
MAWFRKKPDPISDRARALNSEIAALEAQIKTLDHRLQRQQNQPRLRSTALPQGETLNHNGGAGSTDSITGAASAPKSVEPIFEQVDQDRLQPLAEGAVSTPEHYNELGVRKYDLPALVRRVKHQFQGPSTTNPKLVSYLAAGGIQGLRPLRYEKRVARNRFIALVVFLFIVLLGLLVVFGRR